MLFPIFWPKASARIQTKATPGLKWNLMNEFTRQPMLKSIHLKNVGPAPEMEMELAPRLNLITGDNGLGKSFLLDVAWWALADQEE